MRRPRLSALVLSTALAVSLAGPAHACPNCKEAVAGQGGDSSGAAQGFNWSVLFMMCMPFTLLGTGALMVVRAAKRGGFPEL